jgi:hypothetical protein
MLSKDGFPYGIFAAPVPLLRLSRPAAITTSGYTLHPTQHGVLAHLANSASVRPFKAVRSRLRNGTGHGATFGYVPDRQETPRLLP